MEKLNLLNQCIACILVFQITSSLAQNPVREANYNRYDKIYDSKHESYH